MVVDFPLSEFVPAVCFPVFESVPPPLSALSLAVPFPLDYVPFIIDFVPPHPSALSLVVPFLFEFVPPLSALSCFSLSLLFAYKLGPASYQNALYFSFSDLYHVQMKIWLVHSQDATDDDEEYL